MVSREYCALLRLEFYGGRLVIGFRIFKYFDVNYESKVWLLS